MRNVFFLITYLIYPFGLLFLFGCGNLIKTPPALSGIVQVTGPVSNADVQVYALDVMGNRIGGPLEITSSDSEGKYTLKTSLVFNPQVEIVASGKEGGGTTYTDGNVTRTLQSNDSLTAIVESSSINQRSAAFVPVNLLSTYVSVQVAKSFQQKGSLASLADKKRTAVAQAASKFCVTSEAVESVPALSSLGVSANNSPTKNERLAAFATISYSEYLKRFESSTFSPVEGVRIIASQTLAIQSNGSNSQTLIEQWESTMPEVRSQLDWSGELAPIKSEVEDCLAANGESEDPATEDGAIQISLNLEPSNQTASSQGTASFLVSANATPSSTLTYQWQKKESSGVDFIDIDGANGAVLELNGLSYPEDNGDLYRVIVGVLLGDASVTSSAAILTVLRSCNDSVYGSDICTNDGYCRNPLGCTCNLYEEIDENDFCDFESDKTPVISVIDHPSNQTASSGSASFTVSASVTEGATLSYQWQKQENGAGDFSNVSGATSATLSLTGLTNADDDGDIYRVVVSATGGASDVTSSSATVTVTESPDAPDPGTLFAWGLNTSGQLGDGSETSQNTPVQIGTDTWTAVAANNHTVAIRSDGKLFAWGANTYGQLGDGTNTNRDTPVQIGADTWTAVSAGLVHTIALRSDGKLFAWGHNSFGQLGDGTNTHRNTPVQIGTDTWSAIAGGHYHTLAIRNDGKLFVWGYNYYGQLGDGTNSDKNTPVQISTDTWTAIAGSNHTLAIRSDGKLFAWGRNYEGQVGDGTNTNRNTPVQIGADTWIAIAGGTAHALAIRNDGKLFAWGYNNFGSLGDGTNTNRNTPAQVGADTWNKVATGHYHTLAIRNDGKLFVWGHNEYGELGIGSDSHQNTPLQVGNGNWAAISGGFSHSVAIRRATEGDDDGSGGGDGGSDSSSVAPTPVITINTHPSNQIASSGSASFTVSASVTEGATLSYQWQKQESGAGDFSNVSGATSATLSLTGLTNADDDGDIYRVVVSATGGASDVTSSSATVTVEASGGGAAACSGNCYSDSAATTAGVAQGPDGTTMEYVFANGIDGFKIWREQNGNRILNATGLVENGWQKALTRSGTAFDGDFTSSTYIEKIAGRVCPPHVFLSHDSGQMIATGRCLYYDGGNAGQTLDAAHPDNGGALGNVEGQDWLREWNRAATGTTTASSYYEGNIKTCADKGMRLPTLYETAIDQTALNQPFQGSSETFEAYLPDGDGIMPQWAGPLNGVPVDSPLPTWTASAGITSPGYINSSYWTWYQNVVSYDWGAYYDGAMVKCVLPSHGANGDPQAPEDLTGSDPGSGSEDPSVCENAQDVDGTTCCAQITTRDQTSFNESCNSVTFPTSDPADPAYEIGNCYYFCADPP